MEQQTVALSADARAILESMGDAFYALDRDWRIVYANQRALDFWGVTAASASLRKAQLDLSYTKIISPVSGYVSKRSAEVGATVQPGKQLFTIAQTDDIWVTANFKETQLRRMRPGQRRRPRPAGSTSPFAC